MPALNATFFSHQHLSTFLLQSSSSYIIAHTQHCCISDNARTPTFKLQINHAILNSIKRSINTIIDCFKLGQLSNIQRAHSMSVLFIEAARVPQIAVRKSLCYKNIQCTLYLYCTSIVYTVMESLLSFSDT